MKPRYLTAALLAAAALGAGQIAMAQTTPPAAPMAAESKLDGNDRDFLENAAQAGHMEVEGSKLALEKSRNAEVKAFAQKMVDDHGKAGQQLAALAKKKGYDAPTEPSLVQQAKLKTLGLRDEGFDKAYAESIGVSAHEDAVKLFQQAANEAKDPEVKQFATETLPTLEQHLQMAKTLDQGVKKAP
jgi:putative membrane protein